MERLGHGSITTTEKYLHTLPGADDAALDALKAIRGNRDLELDSDVTARLEFGGGTDDNNLEELIELREMVTKFKQMLGTLP